METRLANTWRLTVNETKFIEDALDSELRLDGRSPWEYRKLNISFGKEDGSAEVHLGHTRAMAIVTGELTQPYRDRPNEGSLSIFTEFSPMADPSFEPGRQGESAVELGRIVDRGLRESRAVDMESLCVLAGELVWAIRIDIHILDNGGNLVDAANIATLAALLTFRRPECTFGGDGGKEVVVHSPEVREPLPLIVHHLPIAVTFAFFGGDGKMVVDPTHLEEAVMGGRMTATVNVNGDICAIQKAGGNGVQQCVIMRCLRLASKSAESITKMIKDSVEAHDFQRASRKIKRHPAAHRAESTGGGVTKQLGDEVVADLSKNSIAKLKIRSEDSIYSQKSKPDSTDGDSDTKIFNGGASSWDPFSKGVDAEYLKASLPSRGSVPAKVSEEKCENAEEKCKNAVIGKPLAFPATNASEGKTLKDAVKPKHKRRKQASSNSARN